jgi:hypothetical protein
MLCAVLALAAAPVATAARPAQHGPPRGKIVVPNGKGGKQQKSCHNLPCH